MSQGFILIEFNYPLMPSTDLSCVVTITSLSQNLNNVCIIYLKNYIKISILNQNINPNTSLSITILNSMSLVPSVETNLKLGIHLWSKYYIINDYTPNLITLSTVAKPFSNTKVTFTSLTQKTVSDIIIDFSVNGLLPVSGKNSSFIELLADNSNQNIQFNFKLNS